MSQKTQPDWGTIRDEYIAQKSRVADICLQHGISQSALMQRRLGENWPGRNKPRIPGRKQLVSRMFAVLEKQIARMEIAAMDGTDDKEIALLGQLVRSLEKLVELDTKQQTDLAKKDTQPTKPSRAMRALRQKVAKRITQLEEG
ncbi:MAG: hypothetical protein L3J13_02715 [Devosiaceae bacterium]|nr:hypothetical protein [Devosiaceae bacterium]